MIERNKHLVLVELDFLDKLPDLLDDSWGLSGSWESRGEGPCSSYCLGKSMRSRGILALVDSHLPLGGVANVS